MYFRYFSPVYAYRQDANGDFVERKRLKLDAFDQVLVCEPLYYLLRPAPTFESSTMSAGTLPSTARLAFYADDFVEHVGCLRTQLLQRGCLSGLPWHSMCVRGAVPPPSTLSLKSLPKRVPCRDAHDPHTAALDAPSKHKIVFQVRSAACCLCRCTILPCARPCQWRCFFCWQMVGGHAQSTAVSPCVVEGVRVFAAVVPLGRLPGAATKRATGYSGESYRARFPTVPVPPCYAVLGGQDRGSDCYSGRGTAVFDAYCAQATHSTTP